jgi:hypothetical protein
VYITPVPKRDLERRWGLPDRVFFACGACHILAFTFLDRYPDSGFRAVWNKPRPGFIGHHIVVVRDRLAFDYHGYFDWDRLLGHMCRKAGRWWPGWAAELVDLPKDVLVSEAKSREHDGLWLREPAQFFHDALPRARRFLDRFPHPYETDKPLLKQRRRAGALS